jgi:two-component system, chemotaxis family, sensor kinase CheA
MDDILREFVIETTEAIDFVDSELVRFEQEPNNGAILAQIFRLVHTVKGTCGFLGLPRLESLAHAAETVIGQFRDGVPVTRDAVSLILETIDRIKLIVAEIEANQTEPSGHDEDLIQRLEHMAQNQITGKFAAAEVPQHTEGSLVYQVLERPLKAGEASLDDLERAFRETEFSEAFEASLPVLEAAAPVLAEELAGAGKVEPTLTEAKDSQASSVAKQTIRVNVETLDRLMTMVSELVLTRNQLLEIARRESDVVFKLPLQRLSNITAELQDTVMKTRMQPIGTAWAKLPRLVRDLCGELRKEIDLETAGADTEIDRHVLELIRDPLTHIIRNAADHGIESPEDRLLAGKARRGRLSVIAYQEGGYILVEIADDGRGIDRNKIAAKIVNSGLASADEVAVMSDSQILRYIFRAGFSTASRVTNVSGRGVGMDVVSTNVEQIGGTVDLRSAIGRGTTITIKIPVTLAIASALIVSSSGERFAIPQNSVIELVRARAGSEALIEIVSDTPMLRLRNELLPVATLDKVLDREAAFDPARLAAGFIVVCQVANRRFGVVVDSVLQTEEIVVKPVSVLIRNVRAYSGTTILGDGTVVMILDPGGVGIEMGVLTQDMDRFEHKVDTEAKDVTDPTVSMLIFRAGNDDLMALPLALVTRLEEIEAKSVEFAGGAPMVQYRGKLMPLITIDKAMAANDDRHQLLVFSRGERSAAIVVDQIVDIVDEQLDLSANVEKPGRIGSAIISGKATDILDIEHYLPFGMDGSERRASAQGGTVLLIDPSDFFPALAGPVIKAAGYKLSVSNTLAAAAKQVMSGQVTAVAIDLDDEKLGAFEFVKRIKSDAKFAHVKAIGLVSKGSPALVKRGRDCGFDEIIGKFDRQGLLAAIKEINAAKKEAA